MKRVEIGELDDFPEGKIHGVDVEDRQFVVVNLGGELHALDGICTHAYAELRTGFLLGDAIRCPLHLSAFDVESGEVLGPPAEDPLKKYSLEIEDGRVFIVLD